MLATPHQSTEPSNAEMVETTDASSSSAAPVGVGCDTWRRDSEDDVSSVSAPVRDGLTLQMVSDGLQKTTLALVAMQKFFRILHLKEFFQDKQRENSPHVVSIQDTHGAAPTSGTGTRDDLNTTQRTSTSETVPGQHLKQFLDEVGPFPGNTFSGVKLSRKQVDDDDFHKVKYKLINGFCDNLTMRFVNLDMGVLKAAATMFDLSN
uniref:uncharacterized protein LOC117252458 n=1 Tax=Epinephelus lanceolatus TaxID=310571 RepID=UPI00144603BC|nr:uncharacterized protein LOC117252458 [Epinephelus lanceolatus]